MRPIPLTAVAVLALASCARAAQAQADSRQSAPALVVNSFFRATTAERWHDAAHFLDLGAVGRMRDYDTSSG